TATAAFRLGSSLQSIGEVVEAEPVLERAVALQQKLLSPDDPSLGFSVGALGSLRVQQGRFDEAIGLQQRSVAILTKAYGPNHPGVALALHKLGSTYHRSGDPTTALVYYQKALDVRLQVFGADHEMTLFSNALVGEALVALHRCGEARPLLEKT